MSIPLKFEKYTRAAAPSIPGSDSNESANFAAIGQARDFIQLLIVANLGINSGQRHPLVTPPICNEHIFSVTLPFQVI